MASQYPKNLITKRGLALIAESVATKKPIIFTKVIVGDGDLPDKTIISDMTAVINPKMQLPVTNGVNEGNGQYRISATLSNNEVEIGFFPKEVGLFAKIENGEEILYSYVNGGNNVGYIPDKTQPIESEVYNIRTIIGNATNLKIVIEDTTFITKSELEEFATKNELRTKLIEHDKYEGSHPKILEKIKGAENIISRVSGLVGEGGIDVGYMGKTGFIRFKTGFMIQWGAGRTDERGIAKVTFPVAFTKWKRYVAMHSGTGAGVCTDLGKMQTLTGFTTIIRALNGVYDTGWELEYIAVGE